MVIVLLASVFDGRTWLSLLFFVDSLIHRADAFCRFLALLVSLLLPRIFGFKATYHQN